ncbi:MAG: hypothetical protein IPO21_01385 [Bacteroidales bacterium]|nr:hypothetical protein [Bacteroidales bacterium]
MIKKTILLLAIINHLALFSQIPQSEQNKYNFIRFDKNTIQTYTNTNPFLPIFNKLDNIAKEGEGSLHVLHIGDSHIQADYFSGHVRHLLQNNNASSTGSRGIIFPYRLADKRANDPFNYTWKWTGIWTGTKNTSSQITNNMGITGNYAITNSPNATLTFIQRSFIPYPKYEYDKIKIYHNTSSNSYIPKIINDVTILETRVNNEIGYTEFILEKPLSDTLFLEFSQTDSLQTFFELHGILLELSESGITYSACGVNGSDVSDWLKCNMLPDQIADLQPDLIIISLGTNDCYPKYFNSEQFSENLDKLMKTLTNLHLKVPIILTTPGDNYRSGVYLNTNLNKTASIIHSIAAKYKQNVWDFFEIMGGENSVTLWHQEGLTGKDKLHYTKKGYYLQAELFYDALMKKYSEYIAANYPAIEKVTITLPPLLETFNAEYFNTETQKKKRKN